MSIAIYGINASWTIFSFSSITSVRDEYIRGYKDALTLNLHKTVIATIKAPL